jgi:hypothetical protein
LDACDGRLDRRINVLDQSCARATLHAAVCNARDVPTGVPTATPEPSEAPTRSTHPSEVPTPVPTSLPCYSACNRSCAEFQNGSCAATCDYRTVRRA